MSGRSNWEHKTNPGTATERLARALNRPVNEAIKVDSEEKKPTTSEAKATPGLLGGGAAAGAARALRTRKQRMDEEL
jgi:hypothetical protein